MAAWVKVWWDGAEMGEWRLWCGWEWVGGWVKLMMGLRMGGGKGCNETARVGGWVGEVSERVSERASCMMCSNKVECVKVMMWLIMDGQVKIVAWFGEWMLWYDQASVIEWRLYDVLEHAWACKSYGMDGWVKVVVLWLSVDMWVKVVIDWASKWRLADHGWVSECDWAWMDGEWTLQADRILYGWRGAWICEVDTIVSITRQIWGIW